MSLKLNSTKPLFVLIDANALVHRAYHAFPSSLTITKTGQQINAVYGFTALLLEVFNKFKPDYAVCAFDTAKPTVRHTDFSGYKAHRKPLEQELIDQFPIVYDVVKAFNIPMYGIEGFEADDVIGTLVKKKFKKDVQKIIVTGDSDLLQLVEDGVDVYMSGTSFSKSKLYDKDAVIEKYGFEPLCIIDYKAIKGDASDNIPGIMGIGEKGAKSLITKFGHLDDIYKNIDKVDKKVRQKLIDFYDEAQLSHKLASIITDVPLSFSLQDAELKDYDVKKVKDLFQKLEFRSLINRLPQSAKGEIHVTGDVKYINSGQSLLFGNDIKSSDKKERKTNENYHLIKNIDEFSSFYNKITKTERFAFDVESDSLNYMTANPLGISFSWNQEEAYYITKGILSSPEVVEKLRKVFLDKSIGKIAHNSKFDMHMLRNIEIDVDGELDDTLLAAYLLQQGEGKIGLKELAFNKFGLVMKTFDELNGVSKKQGIDVEKMDEDELGYYSCADADVTFRLYEYYKKEFDKSENKKMHKLYRSIEMPIVRILLKMERSGVALDSKYLVDLNAKFSKRIEKLQDEVYKIVGHQFNLNSPKQLSEVLFLELKLPQGRKNKSGSFSTDERILRDLVKVHPIIEKLLNYRELEKLRSTYTFALIERVNKNTGRIHANFNQAITATGRLSSSDPNLQNIPVADDELNIRNAFVANEGRILLALDIAQQELRVAAILSGEEKLIQAFKNGTDIHKLTASEIFGIPVNDVTKNQRRVGKTLNFSILYGISSFGLSERLKVGREEAQVMIDKFWLSYPKIQKYFGNIIAFAEEEGYVETLMGRRRSAAKLNTTNLNQRAAAVRELINFPIQGTSADLMKMSMIEVDKYLIDSKNKLHPNVILQVHDELVIEVDDTDKLGLRKLAKDLKKCMEDTVQLDVPLIVEPKLGKTWSNLKPFDID